MTAITALNVFIAAAWKIYAIVSTASGKIHPGYTEWVKPQATWWHY